MSEPYIEDGWLVEPCEPDYVPGISQPIPGSWSKPLVNLTDLHGYDEMIAVAEQRGAVTVMDALKREASDPGWEGLVQPGRSLQELVDHIEHGIRADQEESTHD